jgi:hypothetical protein
MNTKSIFILVVCLCGITRLHAQGTAFTYQGRLLDQGTAPNGRYEMELSLWDSLSNGTRVAGPLTNAPVTVSNGLFTTTIDFGSAAFNGSARWLQIGVRTNGSVAAFAPLTPRQSVTPSPYAILARGLNGILPDSQLSVNIARLNANQSMNGDLTIANPYDLNFGSSTRQMVNLYGTTYGIGVQANTLYMRTDNNFAWFRDGVHDDNGSNPGAGGTNLMLLDFAGHLQVNAGVTVDLPAANNGSYYPGLLFGGGSGESIASKRTSGGNQYGIDFYTGFNTRMSIANNGNVGIGTTTPEDALLDVEGNVHINDFDIFLRGGANRTHGLGYRATAGDRNVSGAFFYGYDGGALGISIGGESVTLAWDVRDVWVRRNLDAASLTARSGATIDTGAGVVQFRSDGPVPGINLTGGTIPGYMRFRNALEIWPSDDATRAGKLDIRNTAGNPTITLDGASGAVIARNAPGVDFAQGGGFTELTSGSTRDIDLVSLDLTAAGYVIVTAFVNVESVGWKLTLHNATAGEDLVATTLLSHPFGTGADTACLHLSWVIQVSAGNLTLKTVGNNISSGDSHYSSHNLTAVFVPVRY